MDRLKVHLDTDLGGDIDDLCALTLVLAIPAVEVTGITTVLEDDGRRAGYVRRALALAGRLDVPVAAGADLAAQARHDVGEENHVVGVEVDDVIVWDDDPVDRRELIALHGALEAPADLGGLDRGAEDAPDGSLHQTFEEGLELLQAVDHYPEPFRCWAPADRAGAEL